MLKAVITSPTAGVYGVEFETQSYGRKVWDLPSVYLPCASREHATRVAQAYNGIAYTETRTASVDAPAVTEPPAPAERYRGAPLGVADYTAPDVTPLDTLHFGIRRERLDTQGYSGTGVYWGIGAPLWQATATDKGAVLVSRWFRAPTHAHADQMIRAAFPSATTTTQRM